MSLERLRGVGTAAAVGDQAPAPEGGGLSLVQRATAHRMKLRRKANDQAGDEKQGDDQADDEKAEKGDGEGLEVSQEGDPEEQEADRIADQVVDGGDEKDEKKHDQPGEKKDEPGEKPKSPVQAKLQPGLIHRDPLPPEQNKVQLHDAKTLLGMNLSDLDQYTRDQVDWHQEPSIKGDNHTKLRKVIEFGREGSNLTGCGGMKVKDLVDLDGDQKKHLGYYSSAVEGAIQTVQIGATDDLKQAAKRGAALQQLDSHVGGVQMQHIMKEPRLDPFIDGGEVDPFIKYVETCQPILSADGDPSNKDEISSFVELHKGGDPNRYHGAVKHVRNYHHFQNEALDQLKVNEPQTNDPKKSGLPFNLILHSGLDHNGSFHQAQPLTDAIKSGFSIMVEGAGSLAEIQAELKPLADRYGGGKIGQALLLGHGGPTTMQLAGDVQEGVDDKGNKEMQERDDGMDITQDANNPDAAKAKQDETDALLNELLNNMSNDPKDPGRIVLDACLTNANPDSPALPADKDEAKKAILANPSLTKHIQELVKNKKDDQGNAMNAEVIGANSSFGGETLLDKDPAKKGKFTIIDDATGDPITVPKVEYIETGLEPEGCIRAVLQVWATDQPKCLEAVHKRIKASAGTWWNEVLIRTMYQLVEAKPDDASQINQLAFMIRSISGCVWESDCRTSFLWPLDGDFAKNFFPSLTTTDEYKDAGNQFMRLVLQQKWLGFDAGRKDDFLDAVGAFSSSGDAAKYVEPQFLQQNASVKTLLGDAKVGPSMAQVRLAFILLKRAGDPDAHAFVKELVDANDGKLTPYVDLLADLSNEPSMIALVKPPDAVPDAGDKAPKANADLDADGNNETRLEPLVKDGVAKEAVHVRKGPGLDADIIRTIYPGDPVKVIGKKDEWLAIEDGKKTAFVHSDYIKLS